jgi:hypothetical protein
MSHLLRIVGLVIPVLFHVLAPGSLVGGAIVMWFVVMGFVAGALMRSWWSIVIVPAITVCLWVARALLATGSVQLGGDDFSRTAGFVLISGLLILIAGSTLAGTLAGQEVERRVQ